MVELDRLNATACDALTAMHHTAVKASTDAHRERCMQAETDYAAAQVAAQITRNAAVKIAFAEWDALVAPEKEKCNAKIFEIWLALGLARRERADKILGIFAGQKDDLDKVDQEWRETNAILGEAYRVAVLDCTAACDALPQIAKITAEELSRLENEKYLHAVVTLKELRKARLQASYEQLTAEVGVETAQNETNR